MQRLPYFYQDYIHLVAMSQWHPTQRIFTLCAGQPLIIAEKYEQRTDGPLY